LNFEEQMFPFGETGGNPEVVLQYSLQIPLMEKFERQLFIYVEIGGSPD
jgi:hypothetical protein